MAHVLVRQADRRQTRAQIGGELVIVEGYEGDVVRDTKTGLGQSLVGAKGKPIIEAEECAGAAGLEQLARQVITIARLPVPAAQFLDELKSGLRHGIANALEAAGNGFGAEQALFLLRIVAE
ncbi:hypothetical protein D3C86_1745220 [compost metagenome]